MQIWIAAFYAMVAGTPLNVNDFDQLRFTRKRACYMYVIKKTPQIRQVILEHLPVSREQIEIRGECHLEGSRRASN